MPSELWFLGYLWIPALVLGIIWVFRRSPKTLVGLSQAALVLLLIFFVSRSWLSEQNLNLLFPFMLILVGAGALKSRSVHLVWVVGFVFLVVNMSLLQLLFLVYPDVIALKLAFDVSFGTVRFAARFAVAVVWVLVALGILYAVMRFDPRKSLNGVSTSFASVVFLSHVFVRCRFWLHHLFLLICNPSRCVYPMCFRCVSTQTADQTILRLRRCIKASFCCIGAGN